MPSYQNDVAGAFTWDCPAGVHRVHTQCWGGGGAGSRSSGGNNLGRAGGWGGSYASHHQLRVTPAGSYSCWVGRGGADGTSAIASADSYVIGDSVTTTAKAGPGQSSVNSNTVPSAPAASTGDVAYDGGSCDGGSGGQAGGGGGAAGPLGVGSDAVLEVGGSGNPPGGDGGTGGTSGNVQGGAGIAPGGGGAGARKGTSARDGGAGGTGRVIISWLPPLSGMLLGVGS